MKRTLIEDRVKVEQFTDDCIPDGVIEATDEILDVIVFLQKRKSSEGYYIYKVPFPSHADIEFAEYFNIDHPFQWIKKGDYIVTFTGTYSYVIDEKRFLRDYMPIEITHHQKV
jgi:hypothetical protein